MAKVAAERQSGRLTVDVLWHSEVPDFFQLKNEGRGRSTSRRKPRRCRAPSRTRRLLHACAPGTLGIAYNTKKITARPRAGGYAGSRFKDGFAIANPALSGTAMMSVALLTNTFGWEYIEKLKKNGAKIGAGSGQVVDDTASGDFKASLAPDYIAIDKIKKAPTWAWRTQRKCWSSRARSPSSRAPEPEGRAEVRGLLALEGWPDNRSERRTLRFVQTWRWIPATSREGGRGGQAGHEG